MPDTPDVRYPPPPTTWIRQKRERLWRDYGVAHSQKAVAQALGVSHSYWQKLEAGTRPISDDLRVAYLDWYDAEVRRATETLRRMAS